MENKVYYRVSLIIAELIKYCGLEDCLLTKEELEYVIRDAICGYSNTEKNLIS